MKNCFKTLMALAALIAATAVSAQEETPADPQKETVIVDPFSYSSGISSVARDNVRSAVLSGFSRVGRFHVVDATTDSRLSKLLENREVEDVVNTENWKTESEAAYKELGAKTLLKGQVELHKEYKKIDEKGKPVYYTDLNFTLQVFDITKGTMTGSESYKYSELSYTSYADSFNDIIKKITWEMSKFCNEYFKFETYILELGEADKKGVIADLWISGGTEMGVEKNTIFQVFAEKKLGPKVIRTLIGEIKAIEITDGASRCKIQNKKDGEDIKERFSNGEKLIVIVHKKPTSFIDGASGFLGIRK